MKAFAFGAAALLAFVLGISTAAQAQEEAPPPSTVLVTDKDRTVASFVREAATLDNGVLRVELQGFNLEDDDDPNLDIRGFPLNEIIQQRMTNVTAVNGGFINMLGSYGIGNTAEVGVGIPILWQKLSFDPCAGLDGQSVPCTQENTGIGDMLLYGKVKYPLDDHWKLGGGVELNPPTGSEKDDLGTGELGVNPFVSTRYQWDRVAVGVNIGYQFFTGSVDNVLNYGGQLIVRPMNIFFLRGEIVGRNFKSFGETFNDVNAVFGLDFNFNEYFTIRPTGIANITGDSMDWGIGLGLAGQFKIFE